MAFSGEDLSEYFDADDFDDCHAVKYMPAGGRLPINSTNVFLTERSGALPDGTVRTPYFEVEVNRQEVSDPGIGDMFTIIGTIKKFKISEILSMDNDIAYCEANRIQ